MAINFPSSPATNDTFTGPTGLEYIFDGVKWRSFKPSEPVVGTFNANSAISLSAGGTNQNIVLTPSGTGVVTTPANVGIGTSSPVDKLSVYSSGTSIISVKGDSGVAFIAERASNDATNPGLNFRKYRGTIAAPLTIATGDVLGGSNFLGYDGSALISAASIRGTAETVTGTGDISGALTFLTRPAGTGTSTTERMRITSAGNVGIGNTAPTHNLSVNGTTYMSGNVGIGTISPAAKLDVIGTARIQAASGGGILNILPDAATFTSEVRLHTNSGGSTYQILKNASGLMTIGTRDANPMSFLTNNVERLGIINAGQLLVSGGSSTLLGSIPGSLGNSTVYARIGMTVVNDGATLAYFQTYNSNATTDLKTWRHGGQNDGSYIFQTVNDAYSSSTARLTLTTAGVLSDGKGDVRAAPIQTKSGAYVVTATDAGQTIYISTGGVTINASVLSAGDMISIVNNSASNQTITAGASVTFRLAGTATTGNRTLAQYGMATFLCVVGGATPTLHCSGAGLT